MTEGDGKGCRVAEAFRGSRALALSSAPVLAAAACSFRAPSQSRVAKRSTSPPSTSRCLMASRLSNPFISPISPPAGSGAAWQSAWDTQEDTPRDAANAFSVHSSRASDEKEAAGTERWLRAWACRTPIMTPNGSASSPWGEAARAALTAPLRASSMRCFSTNDRAASIMPHDGGQGLCPPAILRR